MEAQAIAAIAMANNMSVADAKVWALSSCGFIPAAFWSVRLQEPTDFAFGVALQTFLGWMEAYHHRSLSNGTTVGGATNTGDISRSN